MASNRLRDCRKAKNLSQSELARIVNTNHSVIGKFERDEVNPTIDEMKRLADKLDIYKFLIAFDQFKKVKQLPNEIKLLVKEFHNTFFIKVGFQG